MLHKHNILPFNFSEEMGINPGDIISTLQVLGMIKYWKGQHVILKKEDLIDEYLEKSRSRPKHRQVINLLPLTNTF